MSRNERNNENNEIIHIVIITAKMKERNEIIIRKENEA